MLVNSASCIGCNYLASKVAPNLSDEQRHRIIGQGFLTFLATGDPVLVVIDVATNLATEQPIASASPASLTLPAPPSRGTKIYNSKAECILQKGNDIYGAWKDAPILTDASSSQSATFPIVDLLKGDSLVLSARECTEWNDPATGQKAITSATLKYDRSSTNPGGAEQVKYFLIGTVLGVEAKTTGK